jgi:hypothetical protein
MSLAQRTQSTDFAPEMCERVLATARATLQGRDRTESPFGAEQLPPPDANAADRLAAFFGRLVRL